MNDSCARPSFLKVAKWHFVKKRIIINFLFAPSFLHGWKNLPVKWLKAKEKIETRANALDAIKVNLDDKKKDVGKRSRGGKKAMA